MSFADSVPERTRAYIASSLENFQATARCRGHISSRYFDIAGKIVRFEIATDAMERLIVRGMAHLEIADAGVPALTVYAWDSTSAMTPPLRTAWPPDSYGYYGLIEGFNDAHVHAGMQFNPHILRMIDFENRTAIYWMPTTKDLPVWETGAPLRPLLHEWLRYQSCIPVHGGAVGTASGGVFLAGAGGSGKSNLALSCLQSDLQYASDDFCVLSEQPVWTIHSLYSTAKIAAHDLSRHQALTSYISNPSKLDHEKALFFLHEARPEKLIRSMPLKAIVMPRVTPGRKSALTLSTAAAAQKAIAMSTIQMSRATASFTFKHVAAFARALPCYELYVGDDPAWPIIADLLGSASCPQDDGAPLK